RVLRLVPFRENLKVRRSNPREVSRVNSSVPKRLSTRESPRLHALRAGARGHSPLGLLRRRLYGARRPGDPGRITGRSTRPTDDLQWLGVAIATLALMVAVAACELDRFAFPVRTTSSSERGKERFGWSAPAQPERKDRLASTLPQLNR